jgi:hypothetical protein
MKRNVVFAIKRRLFIEIRRWSEFYAKFYLKGRPDLWSELTKYTEKTGSTGCNVTDYYFLYKQIRNRKPLEVLECGTGVSTIIIAHALMENEEETGEAGRVTSMEEISEWAEMAENLLPEIYRNNVEIVVSSTVEDYFSVFRGVRYRDVPKRNYDFVFVDGPKYVSPHDNHPNFDFDYLHVLRNSKIPVAGLIDQRVSTVFVLQQLLGRENVRYSAALGLGFISPCDKSSLGDLSSDLSSSNFVPSFKVLGKTRLSMHPLR